MTKAIVFDLDGTLLDTLTDLAASTNYALRSCGMPEHSIDDVRRFVGNGVRMLMTRALPDGESNPRFDEALSVFRQHYMQHCLDTTCPYPGIMDALARLKEKGMMLAIVSNKMQAATEELRQHFFSQYIDVAIGESAAIRKKPAPDTVNEALRLLGISHDEAIYVGDSDVDIDTACAAMMPCASVLWGFRDRQFLLNHGATRLLSSPEELLSLV